RDGSRFVASLYPPANAKPPADPRYADTARIYRGDDGRPVGEPLDHGRGIDQMVFSPDGRWVVTSGGELLRLWADGRSSSFCPLEGQDFEGFSPDNQVILARSTTGAHRLWRPVSRPGNPVLEPVGPPLPAAG